MAGWIGVGWHLKTRPLPFDAVRWVAGDAYLRFRMKDALKAEFSAGKLPTAAVVDKVLGPDDDPSTNAASSVRYFRLKEWYGNPWYLRVMFDEKGNVLRVDINAD